MDEKYIMREDSSGDHVLENITHAQIPDVILKEPIAASAYLSGATMMLYLVSKMTKDLALKGEINHASGVAMIQMLQTISDDLNGMTESFIKKANNIIENHEKEKQA